MQLKNPLIVKGYTLLKKIKHKVVFSAIKYRLILSKPTHPFHVYPAYKLLFLEVPKAGCTSIKWALRKYHENYDPAWEGMLSRELLSKIGYGDTTGLPSDKTFPSALKEKYYDYTFFTVVRNPYNRFLSLYKDKGKFNSPYSRGKSNFANYFKKFKRSGWLEDAHGCPQYMLLGENLSVYDHVGRIENMDETFDFIDKVVKRKVLREHKNKSADKHKIILTKKQKDALHKMYKKDFLLLGYSK